MYYYPWSVNGYSILPRSPERGFGQLMQVRVPPRISLFGVECLTSLHWMQSAYLMACWYGKKLENSSIMKQNNYKSMKRYIWSQLLWRKYNAKEVNNYWSGLKVTCIKPSGKYRHLLEIHFGNFLRVRIRVYLTVGNCLLYFYICLFVSFFLSFVSYAMLSSIPSF